MCQVMVNGFLQPPNYIDPTVRPMPLWGHRAHRAYLNAVEVFAPFAVLVILIFLTGKENATTAFLTVTFFWLRVIHAFVYWFAVAYIRTIVFTLGFFVVVGLFIELIK